MKYYKAGLAAILTGVLAVSLTACAAQTGVPAGPITITNAERQVITVSSEADVKVEPDMAEIIFSIHSQAADAQTCQAQNSEELKRVIDLLKSKGIDETSIQTSDYGLSPNYNWENGKEITGYEMTSEITISDLPIDEVGTLLTDAVNAGINTIQSVNYTSSQYEEAYQEALTKAIDAAKVKAQVMAEAGGCSLGKVVNIQEYSNSNYRTYQSSSGAMAVDDAGAGMEVMPGQMEITASVSVEFAIN